MRCLNELGSLRGMYVRAENHFLSLVNRFPMKSLHATLFILVVFLSGSGLAQQLASPVADQPLSANSATLREETPAQQSISEAQLQIKSDPKRVQAYNALALAFLRRSRETADPKYLKDADAALAQGLKLDPADFQLQRTQVALMLSRHEWAQAKERATVLHHRTPDDVVTYGYIAEADIALGNYPDAETNAQWMLNLRPNNIPGLLIGAELRTLYGDPRGAIDFLDLAYSETSPTELEELAWIANRIVSIQIESGQIDAAAQTLEPAQQLLPHYPYTMENLAAYSHGPESSERCASTLDERQVHRLAIHTSFMNWQRRRRPQENPKKLAPRIRSSRRSQTNPAERPTRQDSTSF